jgi:hypothetical protein
MIINPAPQDPANTEYDTGAFKDYTQQAFDQIDAALFCGDEFEDIRRRSMMRRFINRWLRRLGQLSEADAERHTPI